MLSSENDYFTATLVLRILAFMMTLLHNLIKEALEIKRLFNNSSWISQFVQEEISKVQFIALP